VKESIGEGEFAPFPDQGITTTLSQAKGLNVSVKCNSFVSAHMSKCNWRK